MENDASSDLFNGLLLTALQCNLQSLLSRAVLLIYKQHQRRHHDVLSELEFCVGLRL